MNNHIAIVTGGLGFIGTAICVELCKLGATVIAVDKADQEIAANWQADQKKLGYNIGFSFADITDLESTEKMIDDVESRFGPIGILVNNAGINRDSLFRKMSLEDWDTVIHTDLNGLFNITRPLINKMCERKFGRIINISSVSAQIGQFGQTNYVAAKAGVHGFSKALAREVAHYGITVNTISPGFIDSNMVAKIPDNIKEEIIKQTPAGRFGKAEEIAWTVAFLASERSGFITGANVSVNGGIHMY